MDLHVPIEAVAGAVASVAQHITEGLDAVVIDQELSTVYDGWVHLILAGNPPDLATASRRAAALGGVVD